VAIESAMVKGSTTLTNSAMIRKSGQPKKIFTPRKSALYTDLNTSRSNY
jgi:hypothetical protein